MNSMIPVTQYHLVVPLGTLTFVVAEVTQASLALMDKMEIHHKFPSFHG